MDEEYKRICHFYQWRIENFNFCWHRTGELLESPLFYVESSPDTSWRLWLYPRGIEDGEYISCYLFRAEGGPEEVDVDFELSVSVGERLVKPPLSFEEIYSLKSFQNAGEKSFALRREIFFHQLPWEERCTLTVGCRIFKLGENVTKATENFGRTTIFMERISGMEVFEDIPDRNPKHSKPIEVKTLLETDPLISIDLSHFDGNLTIKILPKTCGKIKYAVCKITLIKNWERKPPIEHIRHWIGEIKTDIWRYDFVLPQTESDKQDVATNAQETVFLHYDFAYSTGVECANNELNDYGPDLWIENISSLESTCEYVKAEESTGYPTANKALRLKQTFASYQDLTIMAGNVPFYAHKALLHARSSELAEILKDNPGKIQMDTARDEIIRRFIFFLYTDNLADMQCETAMELYMMADKYKVELLKKKCRRFMEINCDVKNVCQLLRFAYQAKDIPLRASLLKFLIAHDEEVFSSDEWQVFTEKYWLLAEQCMLSKYRKNAPLS